MIAPAVNIADTPDREVFGGEPSIGGAMQFARAP